MDYKDTLKFYPDFPVRGVNFVDIIPLMQDKELFKQLTLDLGALAASPNIAAPEARGFLFAAPMLISCDNIANVIPLRKKGKLPFAEGDLVGVDITKEYGKDQIYFRLSDIAAGVPEGDTFNVTFFDDVLATGGTASGIARGLEQCKVIAGGKTYNIKVTDFVFVVEIDGLNGRALLDEIGPVKSLIHI